MGEHGEDVGEDDGEDSMGDYGSADDHGVLKNGGDDEGDGVGD